MLARNAAADTTTTVAVARVLGCVVVATPASKIESLTDRRTVATAER
jgi:hypothetical protein